MAPLIVFLASTLILRLVGRFGVKPLNSWRDAGRVGLAIMFLFTGSTHFSPMKHDLAAMIPPPFTGTLWMIYLTGVLEIAGAIGLLLPRLRKPAALCLVLMLITLFPANVYAALHQVQLRGQDVTPLWFRTPLQLFWILALWWTTLRKPGPERAKENLAPA